MDDNIAHPISQNSLSLGASSISPRSNELAERMVQTVKRVLHKTTDFYKSLLLLRATPIDINGPLLLSSRNDLNHDTTTLTDHMEPFRRFRSNTNAIRTTYSIRFKSTERNTAKIRNHIKRIISSTIHMQQIRFLHLWETKYQHTI